MLVKSLIPTGLKGLVLAGMAAALMATVSTVLNATSTLLTIDLYKKLRPRASDHEQVVVGMITGIVVLTISVLIAFVYIEHERFVVCASAAGLLLHRAAVRGRVLVRSAYGGGRTEPPPW